MDFKGRQFQSDIIIMSTRWYCSYSLSYRNIEEMLHERGVNVDHSTINRWVLKYAPALVKKFKKYKKLTGVSWRVDETYIKVKGKWKYLYRAVDKAGNTVDFTSFAFSSYWQRFWTRDDTPLLKLNLL